MKRYLKVINVLGEEQIVPAVSKNQNGWLKKHFMTLVEEIYFDDCFAFLGVEDPVCPAALGCKSSNETCKLRNITKSKAVACFGEGSQGVPFYPGLFNSYRFSCNTCKHGDVAGTEFCESNCCFFDDEYSPELTRRLYENEKFFS